MNKLKKILRKRSVLIIFCVGVILSGVVYISISKVHAFKGKKEVNNKILYVEQSNKINGQAIDTIENDKEIRSQILQEVAAVEENNFQQLNNEISDDAKEVEDRLKQWNFINDDNVKKAYLTFDDGPSEHVTEQILDILDRNKVKATFFVLGTSIESNEHRKELLRRIANEGHTIANHGYCHDYTKLYPNGVADGAFVINDFNKTQQIINDALGYELSTKIIRLPGGHGSWVTDDLDWRLDQEGYVYVDWNVLNGDAESNGRTAQELTNKLKEYIQKLQGNDDMLVILMHDTDMKQATADSLEQNIQYLKSMGYQFGTLK